MTTILLVEDEAIIREPLAIALRLEGYAVELAGHAGAALERLACVLPDLVILDLMMPGPSGLHLLQHLRMDPRFADLPVLMLTNRVDQQVVQEARRAGAADVLSKSSFSIADLLQRIQALVGHATRTGVAERHGPEDPTPPRGHRPASPAAG